MHYGIGSHLPKVKTKVPTRLTSKRSICLSANQNPVAPPPPPPPPPKNKGTTFDSTPDPDKLTDGENALVTAALGALTINTFSQAKMSDNQKNKAEKFFKSIGIDEATAKALNETAANIATEGVLIKALGVGRPTFSAHALTATIMAAVSITASKNEKFKNIFIGNTKEEGALGKAKALAVLIPSVTFIATCIAEGCGKKNIPIAQVMYRDNFVETYKKYFDDIAFYAAKQVIPKLIEAEDSKNTIPDKVENKAKGLVLMTHIIGSIKNTPPKSLLLGFLRQFRENFFNKETYDSLRQKNEKKKTA